MHVKVLKEGYTPLLISLSNFPVAVGASRVPLHWRERRLLIHLATCKNTMVTKEMLLLSLFGNIYNGDFSELSRLRTLVDRTRKKLAGLSGGEEYIEMVHPLGYMLRDSLPPEVVATPIPLPLAA